MGQSERRAVLLLLGLAVTGHAVRWWVGRPDLPPGAVGLAEGSTSVLRQRDSAQEAGRPLAQGERVDPDRATARELARIPGIGPSLALRIVSDRQRGGPFGTLDGLGRVRGIGPGTLRRVQPYLRFTGAPPARGRINLNRADSAALVALPGIGPVLARAILAYREAHGPFASVEELSRVAGIGRKLMQRLADRVTVH